jgi:alginate production protein
VTVTTYGSHGIRCSHSAVQHLEGRDAAVSNPERPRPDSSAHKVFGEVLDPDLSNVNILTLGLGFRPASNASLDFVYHRYRLNKIAAEIHGWGLTAEMNQVDTRPSKNVGSELDIVLGLRNLFGVKRLGLDVRLGWFFPGDAFVTNVGTDQNPMLRPADKSVALVAKLWW